MAHKDICIKFTVGGRHFEAVGFLEEGESSVDGDTMLARTDGKGAVVGEEDYPFISEYRADLPEALRQYYLVTKRRMPDYSRSVSYFCWVGGGWSGGWGNLGPQWSVRDLVLRRCT